MWLQSHEPLLHPQSGAISHPCTVPRHPRVSCHRCFQTATAHNPTSFSSSSLRSCSALFLLSSSSIFDSSRSFSCSSAFASKSTPPTITFFSSADSFSNRDWCSCLERQVSVNFQSYSACKAAGPAQFYSPDIIHGAGKTCLADTGLRGGEAVQVSAGSSLSSSSQRFPRWPGFVCDKCLCCTSPLRGAEDTSGVTAAQGLAAQRCPEAAAEAGGKRASRDQGGCDAKQGRRLLLEPTDSRTGLSAAASATSAACELQSGEALHPKWHAVTAGCGNPGLLHCYCPLSRQYCCSSQVPMVWIIPLCF